MLETKVLNCNKQNEPVGEPSENDAGNEHEAREEEELVGLPLDELGFGNYKHYDVAEGHRQQPYRSENRLH